MHIIVRHLRKTISILVGFVAYLLGGFDTALQFFLLAVMFDVITGVLKAIIKKEIDSNISYKGTAKKFGMFVMIAIVTLIDRQQGANGEIRKVLINILIIHESISALENLGAIEVPFAKIFKNYLQVIKEKLKDDFRDW